MRRRHLTGLLGGAIATWSAGLLAQRRAVPVIGFLSVSSASAWADNLAAFRQGLKASGFVEGENVAIEYRWANGDYARLPSLANELVLRQVALITATGGPQTVRAAMAASSSIPVVFTLGADPVALGFVTSLARPNANATGVTLFTSTLTTKRLELLNELVSKATTIGLLVNPNNPNATVNTKESLAMLRSVGRQSYVANLRGERDLDRVFQALGQLPSVAIAILADPLFESQRAQIVALASRYAVPAIYPWREDVYAGGLMSYGTSITDMYRQAGVYAAKILKGAKPAELPVMQPTRLELVINLKTAKALGLTIPQSLLLRADEVIQ